jgi:biopolymer transport protein ExbB
LAEFLAAGLAAKSKSRIELEKLLILKGDRILSAYHQRLHALELISNVAPLLGLLGTVTGMVQVFQKIAGLTVAAAPAALAGGIWEALLTTVFGLIIAIPALAVHHLLINYLKTLALTLQQAGEELLNNLFQMESAGSATDSFAAVAGKANYADLECTLQQVSKT